MASAVERKRKERCESVPVSVSSNFRHVSLLLRKEVSVGASYFRLETRSHSFSASYLVVHALSLAVCLGFLCNFSFIRKSEGISTHLTYLNCKGGEGV